MSDTIVLNVHMEAKDGREEDLARELQSLVAPTRQEQGCPGSGERQDVHVL
jgi:quinol monooxygenase YgiN